MVKKKKNSFYFLKSISKQINRFHAIDSPIIDPIALRKAKREKSLANITLRSGSIPSYNSSSSTPTRLPPKQWVPFSKRDTMALEKAFKVKDIA